jgi:hypothetical protein
MQREIYLNLPVPIRALVDEVEAKVGFAIEVLPRSARNREWIAGVDEGTVGVITGFDKAVIEYPGNLASVTHEDFAHELLHMRRAYVDKVPHLYPKQKSDGAAAAGIDNWLEHIVIYKQQLELCPNFAITLNSDLTEFWTRFPSSLSGRNLRFNLISRYLITHRYAQSSTRKHMKEAIQRLGPAYSVRRAARSAEETIRDKRAFVTQVLRFCSIPTNLFWLRWHDVTNRQNQWFEI